MCQKHTNDAIESFQDTIVNMANRLGPDDSRKLLEYLNILERFSRNQTEPVQRIKETIVPEQIDM